MIRRRCNVDALSVVPKKN